jgi:hypothetical protein
MLLPVDTVGSTVLLVVGPWWLAAVQRELPLKTDHVLAEESSMLYPPVGA